MIGCLPTQALAFLAVFVYATQAIAFEWKPGLRLSWCCVSSAEDAVEAVKRGVSGIAVSNHGGRQLDTVPATVCLSVCTSTITDLDYQ